MKNNTFEEIAEQINSAESLILYPHVNMDGDTLGSCAALCHSLRSIGKECWVLYEGSVPLNLKFMTGDMFTEDENIIESADISMCIDCGDTGRLGVRKDKFLTSPVTICIDHHTTTDPFCQFNYIDPQAAATGQLIFKLLRTMNIKIDKQAGEAIFAAITTDTGNFQYTNTSKETHLIAAELYDSGIDFNSVSVQIYENKRKEKILITSRSLETLKMVSEGRGGIARVTQEMLAETGAEMSETDGIVEEIRCIAGVEISCLLKEDDENVVKVSMRVKNKGNVAEIAAKYNGGGHVKAAGFTLQMSMDEAFDTVSAEIIENIRKYG